MSDFDKEAEREKLREKYERDKAEREATQRMSDLLLKGATMTNSHCGTCGDPLFQEDGTTFCPSCHGNPDAVQGTDLEAQPADESTAQVGDDGDQSNRPSSETAGADPATAADALETDPATVADRTDQTAETDPASDSVDRPSSIDTPSRATANKAQRDDHHDGSNRQPSSAAASPSPGSNAGDLGTARDSLVAALEKFAREAAETDDPRYAKECLEAAREASETLETLR